MIFAIAIFLGRIGGDTLARSCYNFGQMISLFFNAIYNETTYIKTRFEKKCRYLTPFI